MTRWLDNDHCNQCGRYRRNWFDPCRCAAKTSHDPVRAKDVSDALMAELQALAAGSRRAKTPKAVECEASQSGPKGNAQNRSED
jgi:hypothetical protein